MGPTYLVVMRCLVIALSGANAAHAYRDDELVVCALWCLAVATWTWASVRARSRLLTTVRAEARVS